MSLPNTVPSSATPDTTDVLVQYVSTQKKNRSGGGARCAASRSVALSVLKQHTVPFAQISTQSTAIPPTHTINALLVQYLPCIEPTSIVPQVQPANPRAPPQHNAHTLLNTPSHRPAPVRGSILQDGHCPGDANQHRARPGQLHDARQVYAAAGACTCTLRCVCRNLVSTYRASTTLPTCVACFPRLPSTQRCLTPWTS